MLPLEFKDVIDWYNVQYNVTSISKSLTKSTTSDVEHNMSSELYLIEIGENNTIKLPDSFVKYCKLVKGQQLVFQANNDGSIIIRTLRT
jgi:hypothetical protein